MSKTREELLALLPEPLQTLTREQLALGSMRNVPIGHCVACGQEIDQSRVWLLLNGGLEAHEECEAVAAILVPNPCIQTADGPLEMLPMRMHPPVYSVIELGAADKKRRRGRKRAERASSAPDIRKPWKRR